MQSISSVRVPAASNLFKVFYMPTRVGNKIGINEVLENHDIGHVYRCLPETSIDNSVVI